MLERLSASVDGARQKTAKKVSDRLHVLGGRKQVPFHIVISELRAELITNKQYAPGQPCVLKWVRGETVHVSEDSIGQTVHSWSDIYFAQVVSLQLSGSSFRAKECKFKVQQKGKTIAKTATLDLAKYCSESGLARDQKVSLPLQPSGTLFFVISTAPASDQQQQHGNDAPSSEGSARNLMRVSHNPSIGGERISGMVASIAGVSESGTLSLSTETSRHYIDTFQSAGGRAAASASSLGGAVIPQGLGKGQGAIETTETAASTPDEGERVSTSGVHGGHQRKPLGGTPAGWVAGFAAAATSGAKGSPSTPQAQGADGINQKGQGTGVFKRKGRGKAGKATTAFATASGAVAASGAAMVSATSATPGGKGQVFNYLSTLRKSDSDNIISGAVSTLNLRSSWDIQAERSISLVAAAAGGGGRRSGASGSGFVAAGHRTNRSFTGTPPASRGAGPQSSPLQFQLPPSALEGVRSLARRSGAASTCSDTAASTVKAAVASISAAVEGAAAGGGGSGGGGWGSWLRGGLGWGRSSNQSATGMSMGAISLPNGGGAVEQELSPLEVAIMGATEAAELRELALDLMHERDEWRARVFEAQDALGRAQASRGSAVREVQRLEVRLRQYQDELGRRTDGSLLKELVEAKVRIAELANENIKLRRQITHMGPLFYDDSGDEA